MKTNASELNKLSNKKQVLIVGAGPVGMILTSILYTNGVDVILIDKRCGPTQIPRAIAVNQATLDTFKMLGLDELFDQGISIDHIDLYWCWKKIGEFGFKGIDTEFPNFFHIEQSSVENSLEESLIRNGVDYYRGIELVEIKNSNNSIRAKVKGKNGKIFIIECNYLIGCDGGQSTVRALSKFDIDQSTYGTFFALADVEFKEKSPFKNTCYIFKPDGYAMIVPIPNNKYRIIFSFKSKNNNLNVINSNKNFFQSLLSERVFKKLTIKKIYWQTGSSFGHKISQSIYDGNVILAGDALHQFSPVGGTNMNFGIQDAISLGWRLIYQLKGIEMKSDYFKAYNEERKNIIDRQREATHWATALMTRSKNYSDKKVKMKSDEVAEQLLGYSALSDEQKHCLLTFGYSELKNKLEIMRKAFLNAKFVLVTERQSRISDENFSKIKFPVKHISIDKNGQSQDRYWIFRPDGILANSGNITELDNIYNM